MGRLPRGMSEVELTEFGDQLNVREDRPHWRGGGIGDGWGIYNVVDPMGGDAKRGDCFRNQSTVGLGYGRELRWSDRLLSQEA